MNGLSGEELTQDANVARAKLLESIELLNGRWRDLLDVKLQLRRHARQLALWGIVVGLAAAAAVQLAVHRSATRRPRLRRQRWLLAKSLWRHPDRALARGGKPRGFVADVLTVIAWNFATRLAAAWARQQGRNAVPD